MPHGQTGALHDPEHLPEVGLPGLAGQRVIKFFSLIHFIPGDGKALGDDFIRIGGPSAKPLLKLTQACRTQKNSEQRLVQNRVVRRRFADGRRALHVDVEQYVAPLGEFGPQLRLQHAVMVPVHDGVLQKLATFDSAEELILSEKIIIDAIQLAIARLAGGTGHRTAHAWQGSADVVAKRGFAGPGWGGDHHDKRRAGNGVSRSIF